MKIVFMTKQGWWILLAVCVFVLGNCILLYRFINKTNFAELEKNARLKEISERYLASLKAGPRSKLADIAVGVQNLQNRPVIGQKSDVFEPGNDEKENIGLKEEGQKSEQTEPVTSSKRDVILSSTAAANDFVAAVLVIACNRPTVKRCLDLLLKYRPSAKKFPIIVSQDCGHEPTANVIRSYGDQVSLIQQPDLSEVQDVPANMRSMMGYYKISRHYKWALGQAFETMGYDTVLIVEDDLDVGKCFIS